MATILFLVVALDWFRTEWSLFAIRFYTDFYKFSGVKFSTSGQFPVSEFRIGYFFNFLYHPGSSIVNLSCLKLELRMNWFFLLIIESSEVRILMTPIFLKFPILSFWSEGVLIRVLVLFIFNFSFETLPVPNKPNICGNNNYQNHNNND